MRALVTGSNGFIGSFLVEKCLDKGYDVRCLVRRTSNLRWIENLDVELVYGELNDPESLAKPVRDVEIIFHVGGVTKARTEQDFMRGNYHTTKNLLDAAARYDRSLEKFLFISSQAAGGPSPDSSTFLTEKQAQYPISAYGRAKLLAERQVLNFSSSFHTTILRPPAVYGPRDKDFLTLFRSVKRGWVPMLGSGQQRISIIYIDDLIEGIFLSLSNPKARGELYFLSSDEAPSYRQLIDHIAASLYADPRIIALPSGMVHFFSLVSTGYASLTRSTPLINRDKVTEMRQFAWLGSNKKAKQQLGFNPTVNLQKGMSTTANWYTRHQWL